MKIDDVKIPEAMHGEIEHSIRITYPDEVHPETIAEAINDLASGGEFVDCAVPPCSANVDYENDSIVISISSADYYQVYENTEKVLQEVGRRFYSPKVTISSGEIAENIVPKDSIKR
ncbi:hypothetical protein [Nitrospirillum pindoramense]|uniref:hypothetical protein n=1 Tax=Nitrospirillum amazonense TaxID=28077 RepID=UPI00119E14A2|nr:hypothetical protein [Nitrospirillum amazonense]